jgi:polyisoprenoid-binding protein YceI
MTTITQSTPTIVPDGEWRLDPERSRLEWKVEGDKNHYGHFGAFEGTVTPNRIEGVVQAATVEADDPGLTAHLRSPDFLGAEQNPEIRFTADEIEHAGGDVFFVRGVVTIGPVAQPVQLSARADESPRVKATGTVTIGDVSATVLVDAELLAA